MREVRPIRYIFVIALLLLVIGAHYLGWLKPFETGTRSLLLSASRFFYHVRVQSLGARKTPDDIGVLTTSYESLLGQYEAARQQLTDYTLLQEENAELRSQLKYLSRHAFLTIGADVIGMSTDPLRRTVIINRGRRDGVSPGNPVIVQSGILVGKIAEVDDTTAIVQLMTDHQSRVAATIVGQDKSLGLVEGGYGVSIQMNFIPQNETIRVGDQVVTSGLETGIPHGFFIGTVEAVEKEAYQPFQRAVVTPATDLDLIQIVSVVTPTDI